MADERNKNSLLINFWVIIFLAVFIDGSFFDQAFTISPLVRVLFYSGDLSDTYWGCLNWIWDGPEGNAFCYDEALR